MEPLTVVQAKILKVYVCLGVELPRVLYEGVDKVIVSLAAHALLAQAKIQVIV
jgi:hypothetical protein